MHTSLEFTRFINTLFEILQNAMVFMKMYCLFTYGILCRLQPLTTAPPSPTMFVFYAPFDKYLERKLFCSSVIYKKAYISFL